MAPAILWCFLCHEISVWRRKVRHRRGAGPSSCAANAVFGCTLVIIGVKYPVGLGAEHSAPAQSRLLRAGLLGMQVLRACECFDLGNFRLQCTGSHPRNEGLSRPIEPVGLPPPVLVRHRHLVGWMTRHRRRAPADKRASQNHRGRLRKPRRCAQSCGPSPPLPRATGAAA
jgi:hypothetical protein